jgi:hypothetical protein
MLTYAADMSALIFKRAFATRFGGFTVPRCSTAKAADKLPLLPPPFPSTLGRNSQMSALL